MLEQRYRFSRRQFIKASLLGSAFMGVEAKSTDVSARPNEIAAADGVLTNTSVDDLAFPGAEGFGARTPGGRGGAVLFVTTLDDYHPDRDEPIPGSLRAAVDTKGPRIVVFRVSGNIELKHTLTVAEPFLTMTGHDAPQGGVCIKNYDVSVRTHDVVIRYMRFRPGDEMGPRYRERGEDFKVCGLSMNRGARNVIVDHCSASWSTDEVLSVSGEGITNVTVQWCIISESLNDSYRLKGEHGYGSIIRTNGNVTYHHNLYVNHKSRTPRPGTYGEGSILLDFRNNVIHNAVWGGYSARDPVQMNYVGNYIKRGPNSLWDCGFLIGGETTFIFHEDNLMVKRDDTPHEVPRDAPQQCATLLGPLDEIELGERRSVFANVRDGNMRSRPFPTPPVDTDSPTVAYQRVLAGAGATLPVRDAVDRRVVDEVRMGEGQIIDSQSEVDGWPDLAAMEVPEPADEGDESE